MRLIAEPRWSDSKMSPMMLGLSTLEATANPVSQRAAMRRLVLVLPAARKVAMMKTMLQAFMTG